MVLYEYVGKMLRKEWKIVVENVKKLMRKAMGIVLSVVLTLGCILGSGTIAWAEGEMPPRRSRWHAWETA